VTTTNNCSTIHFIIWSQNVKIEISNYAVLLRHKITKSNFSLTSDEGLTVVLVDEGLKVVPVDEGLTVVPLDEGSTVVPVDEGLTVVPLDEGSTVVPVDVNLGSPPLSPVATVDVGESLPVLAAWIANLADAIKLAKYNANKKNPTFLNDIFSILLRTFFFLVL
jgi:hypothetical protein